MKHNDHKIGPKRHQANVAANNKATKGEPARTYNFLTVLACAQQCNIDFTGMTWVDVQGQLGEGGQATISKSEANLKTGLAYKRRITRNISSRLSQRNIRTTPSDVYHELASEIMVLGNSSMRQHKHIVCLLAICWEIQNVASWTPVENNIPVWPVLIFEKAQHGDLLKFISENKEWSLVQRIRLCQHIAGALAVAHKNDIIHGDIKPENVLVFQEDKDIIAKLSDFGFAGFNSNNIKLAQTKPWAAPEVGIRKCYSLSQAKLTDVYSFGVLCLWVVFRESLAKMEPHGKESTSNLAIEFLRNSSRPTKSMDRGTRAINSLINKNSSKNSNVLRQVALKFCDQLKGLALEAPLRLLFGTILVDDPNKRSFTTDSSHIFEDILQLLDDLLRDYKNDGKVVTNVISKEQPKSMEIPDASAFMVSKSLQQLCLGDFRLRRYIYECLKKERNCLQIERECLEKERECLRKERLLERLLEKQAANLFQLAFCKRIGFGTTRDHEAAQSNLNNDNLDEIIVKTYVTQGPSSTLLKELFDTGTIQAINQGLEFLQSETKVRKQIGVEREKEIELMERSLSSIHPAVVNLKWSFFRLLIEDYDDILAPFEFLHKLVKSLEEPQAENSTGEVSRPSNQNILIAKAYRVYSLMGIRQTQIRRMALAEAQSVDEALKNNGLGEHVAAIMVCLAIADGLSMFGKFEDAEKVMKRASQIVVPKFGLGHSLSLTVAEKSTEMKSPNGPMSTEEISENLEKSLKTMDPNAPAIRSLRTHLASKFIEEERYDEADKVIHAKGKIFAGCNEIATTVPILVIYAASMRGNYKEAVLTIKPLITKIKNEAWPPHSKKSDGYYIKVNESMGLRELMKIHETPMPPEHYPNPENFTVNPELMVLTSSLAIYLQAQALSEPLQAPLIQPEADEVIKSLLGNIKDSFQLGDHVDIPKSETAPRGLANSVIRAAMDKQHTPLVEILTSLGFRGLNDGMYYKFAISVANAEPLLTAILEEHYAICGHMNDVAWKRPTLFKSREELANWITGVWKGGALYAQLGAREDPQGVLVVELQAEPCLVDNASQRNGVVVAGNYVEGKDGLDGKYKVQGTVDMMGNLTFELSNVGQSKFSGVRAYAGRVNIQRGAIGGLYQNRASQVIQKKADGSFFLYKTSRSNAFKGKV